MKKFINLHTILSFFSALGIMAGIFMAIEDRKPPLVAQPVAEPSYSPYKEFIAGSGIIEAETENISLGSYLPGIVDEIFVEVGNKVTKNQPVFKLDQRQTLRDVEIKKAQLLSAESNLYRSRTTLKDAEEKFELIKNLKTEGAISKEEYLVRKNNVLIAKAGMQVAQSEVKTAKANLEQSLTNLELLTVKAPLDCTILQINIHPGEYVTAGQVTTPLILLGGATKYHIRADIDENDAWRFIPNTKAIAYLRGNSALKVPLQFKYYEPYIIPKKNLTGASTERVDVRVLQILYSYDPQLLPSYIGQQVDVYIEVPSDGS